MPIHTPEHFRGVEPPPILRGLLLGQTGEMATVSRSAAQEECTEYNIAYLPILIPESTVRRQIHQFALVVADQHNRIIEIDRLDQPAHNVLHGF